MTNVDKVRDEEIKIILTEKQQKHQHYHQVKLINMSFLQVNKCYHLIKGK